MEGHPTRGPVEDQSTALWGGLDAGVHLWSLVVLDWQWLAGATRMLGMSCDAMMKIKLVALMAIGILAHGVARAETCITQSAMTATERDALATAARSLAAKVQAGDASGLRAATVPEYAKDFGGIGDVVASTAPKLKGGTLTVEQVYVLDASELKRAADGSASDAQFFCSLNHSIAEADFLIPGLIPGRYGFAIVDVTNTPAPWRLSFLLRQDPGGWAMAGFYPKPMTAAGHDGLWYWTQARTMAARKEHWNAWLYYQQAESLLRPTNFIQSTHLEKLHTEQAAATPTPVSDGVGPDNPLVVKGADGAEYRFTGLGVDDSLGKDKVDIIAHLKVDQIGDPAAARKRNSDAMVALLAAYPEMRKPFHGVWVFSEEAGKNPFATEQPMEEIR